MSRSSHVFVFRVVLAPLLLLLSSTVVSYNMLASFVETKAALCYSSALAVAGRYSYLYCRFWLRACLSLMGLIEDAITRIIELESRVLSLPACGVHLPQESAIVIIGGDAGLGQAISLSLSELGYTIFVLCPNSPPGPCDAIDRATKSSAVSSLLYAWHRRKERSIHTSWGLIAPILCDMSESGAKHTHAFETVHAYCDKHFLKLTALIVLSPSSPGRRQEFRHRSSCRRAQSELLGIPPSAVWSSPDGPSLLESVPIVEDYVGMLSRASGRVILLSYEGRECYFCRPITPFSGVEKRIARNLNDSLETFGIKAIAVSVGPVAASLEEEPSEASQIAPASQTIDENSAFGSLERGTQNTSGVSCSKLHVALSNLFRTSTIEYGAFCTHMRQVITTRYPRYSYSMGLYPLLDSVRFSLPDVLYHLLRQIFTESGRL